MTVQDVLTEMPRFTFNERLRLIESLSLSLRSSELPLPRSEQSLLQSSTPLKPVSASEVRGVLKPDNGEIPSDEEVKEIIADYLMEKYS